MSNMSRTAVRSQINFLELGAQLLPKPSVSRAGFEVLEKTGCLIVLDIHGVLVERINDKERERMRHAKAISSPWRRQKRSRIWLRPHLKRFLEVISARHDVAVWSSAQTRTIDDFLNGVSAEFKMEPPYEERLSFKWDRSKCKPDQVNGRYATMKYLKDLWEDPMFRDRYSYRNTLLLDDSPKKNRFFPNSGVVVPEYRAEILQNRYRTDDTLLWMLLYLEYLITVSKEAREENGLFDISQSRGQCLALQDFIFAGELEARRLTNYTQRKRLRSLALVFLEGVDSKSDVHKPARRSASEHGEAKIFRPAGLPSSV